MESIALHKGQAILPSKESGSSRMFADMDTLGSRLRQAREEADMTQSAVGDAMGISSKAVSQWENDKTKPESGNLIEVARIYRVEVPWLLYGSGQQRAPELGGSAITDVVTHGKLPPRQMLPRPNASAPVAAPRDSGETMPILGLGRGGLDGKFKFNGQSTGYVTKPQELEGVPDAYGIYVEGDSMRPRFREGQLLLVHPHMPPRREDDVVVQLYPDHDDEPPEGYIKEFRAWKPSKLVLWQWNPPEEIEIDRALVKSIHVIVGTRR